MIRHNCLLYMGGLFGLMMIGCNSLDGPNPEDVFVKYYGRGSNETKSLVSTDEGDMIILASNSLDGGSTDLFLIKTGPDGNALQTRVLDLSNGSVDVPVKIRAIGNDEYVVVGHIDSDPVQGVWFKINSDLEITSSDSTGNTGINFLENVYLTDIIKSTETDDVEKFVLLGHTNLHLSNDAIDDGGSFQIYLSKVDDNDSTYWVKPHGNIGDEESKALFENADGSLFIVGSTSSQTGQYTGKNIYLLHTNSLGTPDGNGRVVAIPGADDDADDIPYGVIQTPGGYSIVGTSKVDGSLTGFYLGVTREGEKVDGRSSLLIDQRGLSTQAYGVTRTLSADYIVVGSYPSFRETTGEGGSGLNKLEEIMVSRVSAFGEHKEGFDHNYGTTSGNDRANAVITLPDGDVLVAATVDFGSGVKMVSLLRLNRFGELKD